MIPVPEKIKIASNANGCIRYSTAVIIAIDTKISNLRVMETLGSNQNSSIVMME